MMKRLWLSLAALLLLTTGLANAYASDVGPRRALLSSVLDQGGAVVTQPTLPANPKIAILGASRFRQNDLGQVSSGKSTMYSYQQGWLEWAYVIGPSFDFPVWQQTDNYSNASGTNGFSFSLDGQVLQQMERRIPKILASDADLVIVNTNIGSVSIIGDGSVTAYCNYLKSIILRLYGHKYVVLENLWERGTNSGGIWISGGVGRTQTPTINSTMASWAATLGIPVIDSRSTMIDLASADKEPISAYVRGPTDTTHQSNVGAYVWAKNAVVPTLAAILPAYTRPDPFRAGNLVTNAALTGTGGTVGTGGTGTLPDGATFTRGGGTTATTALSVSNEAPVDTTRFGATPINFMVATVGNLSGIAANGREGGAITITVTGLTIGHWYEFASLVEQTASTNSGGIYIGISEASGVFSLSMVPTETGGSNNAGIFNTSIMPVTQEAWSGRLRTQPYKATATSATLGFRFAGVIGAGTPTWKIGAPEVRDIPDPNLHFTASANPTFTSAASVSAPEELAGSFNVTNAAPCQFGAQSAIWSGTSGGYSDGGVQDAAAITGADAVAGGFTIDAFGLLTWPALDFENPADSGGDNVYNITLTCTPFDTARSPTTQNFALTITDTNDGYTDPFTDTALLDLGSHGSWTRVAGATAGIRIIAAGTSAQNNSAVTPNAYYLAPQQGNTVEQQVTVQFPNTTARPSVLILSNSDGSTHMRAGQTGAGNVDILIAWQLAGVAQTSIGTVAGASDLYKAIASFDRFTYRVIGTNLEVYQNTVLVKTFDISSQLTAGLSAAKFSGMRNNTAGGTTGSIDNWNNRQSPATYPASTGLRVISIAPTTGTAGALYIGLLTGKTAGSSISIGSLKKDGVTSTEEWVADGTQIRGSAPTAGTWTMNIIENYPGAVNDGRSSPVTITIAPMIRLRRPSNDNQPRPNPARAAARARRRRQQHWHKAA